MKKVPENILSYKFSCIPKTDIQEIAQFFGIQIPSSLKKARALARTIESYSNAIPVWAFRGRSSMDMMCDSPALRVNEAMSMFFEHQMAGLYRAAVIGPEDPCPCGSGLKYKNCHGKNWHS
ncbi:MAG: SEC-C domain-containing protein [Bacteroidales bacterium]|nr:SEC-C domain-containing protein [Bacteroidales bacterium]